MEDWMASGKRVSNAWVICPRVGDNNPKGLLIPHKPTVPQGTGGEAGDRKAWRLRMSPRPIS